MRNKNSLFDFLHPKPGPDKTSPTEYNTQYSISFSISSLSRNNIQYVEHYKTSLSLGKR